MTTPTPVDVARLGRHLNMTEAAVTDNADELGFWLAAGTLAVEGRVGPIVSRSFTERRTATNGVLVVSKTPLVSVEALATVAGTTVAGTIDAHPAGIVSRRGDCLYGEYDVTFTAGRGAAADIPENLGGAVLVTAGHLWETQRGTVARGRTLGEFDGGTSTEMAMVLRGFALPRRALELLQAVDPGLVFA